MKAFITLAGLLCLAAAATAQPLVTVDGSAKDPVYGGLALVEQDTQTQFGNAIIGRPDFANGSELDSAYGVVTSDGGQKWLCLMFGGNLESNSNKFEIFFDSRAGGQNQLTADNPGNALKRMGANPSDANQPGLKFATGFEADFWVSVTLTGNPATIYVDYAELYVDAGNPGAAYYAGSGFPVCAEDPNAVTDGGQLTGGDVGAPTLYCTIDNSNVFGVEGGTGFTFLLAPVTTGIEVCVPLAALGNPTGNIAVTAFVNGQQHDYVSNQVLGGLGGGVDNLQEPRTVDFSTFFFHAPFNVSSTPVDPVGACCLGVECVLTTASNCAGVFKGPNTSCDDFPCAPVPVGRCCIDNGYAGTCKVLPQAVCESEFGYVSWTPGEDCSTCACLLPPTGACCRDGVCTTERELDCTGTGGVYAGDNTTCNDSICDVGACCDSSNQCTEGARFQCVGGTFFEGLTCASNPCAQATITTPYTAGSMQSPNQWDPSADPMTETAPGSRVWTRLYTGLTAGAFHQFKITKGDWSVNLPGSNAWAYADTNGELLITYDSNFYNDGWFPRRDRLPLAAGNMTATQWTAVGSFQSEATGDPNQGDWDNASTRTLMLPTVDAGIYMYETALLPPGDYAWKAVKTGSWDSISIDGRGVGTSNWDFTVPAGDNVVRFYVDALGGRTKLEIEPAAPPVCLGDVNCDGAVTFADIDPFVARLGCPSSNPTACNTPSTCTWVNADINQDGAVTFADIDPFVGTLGSICN